MAEVTLSVELDGNAASELQEEWSGLTSGPARIIGERDLDGSLAESIVVLATTTVTQLPAILDSLRRFLDRNRVTELRVGNTRIVDPRPADLDRLGDQDRPAS